MHSVHSTLLMDVTNAYYAMVIKEYAQAIKRKNAKKTHTHTKRFFGQLFQLLAERHLTINDCLCRLVRRTGSTGERRLSERTA